MEFLVDRTQAIIFNGEISSDTPIMRGVAKGMVLGPILILVMIQNIEDLELNSIFPMFSDDMQLTHPINNLHDVELLQEDLDKLYNWEKNNNIKFNISKFKWLQLGSNIELKNSYDYMSDQCTDSITPYS